MKAMIIDDEPPARRELRRLLTGFSWVEVVGEAGNVDQAAELVQKLTPELLFLDIQMPGGTGFDLLSRLEDVPQVIFTTAYDEHAVRAFKVDALDYLLKPIEPARLQRRWVESKALKLREHPSPMRFWSKSLSATAAAAGSCRSEKCACSPQRAITFGCRGECPSRFWDAHWQRSNSVSIRIASSAPIDARLSIWISSKRWNWA